MAKVTRHVQQTTTKIGPRLLLEIKVVVVGATGVESRLTVGAGIVAAQVAGDAEGAVAIAAVDGFGVKLGFRPNLRGMVGGLLVALDAGVKSIAALVPDGDNVALGMVVGALGAGVNARAATHC